MAGKGDKKGSSVIIKRYEIVEAGHHGGAWKVAYADFVTAMMAFFLLMWLLNATTQDQRKGLADYFSPNNMLSHASSGTGEPFGGHTAYDAGALVSDRGSVEITEGKRPPLENVEEGESQVFNRPKKPGTDNVTDPVEEKPDPSLLEPDHTGRAPKGALREGPDGPRDGAGSSAREVRDPPRPRSRRKKPARKKPPSRRPPRKSARWCAPIRRWPNLASNSPST